jgi:hypothetical protein
MVMKPHKNPEGGTSTEKGQGLCSQIFNVIGDKRRLEKWSQLERAQESLLNVSPDQYWILSESGVFIRDISTDIVDYSIGSMFTLLMWIACAVFGHKNVSKEVQ